MSRLVELLTTMNEKKMTDKEMQDEYLAKGGKINTGKSSDGIGSSNKVSAKTAAGLDADLDELNTRSQKAKETSDEDGRIDQATKQGQRLTVKLTSTDFDIPSDFNIETQIAVGATNNTAASDGIQELVRDGDKYSIGDDTTIKISVGSILDIFAEIDDAAVIPTNTKFALQISGDDVKYANTKGAASTLSKDINAAEIISYSSASATKGKIDANNAFKLKLNLVMVAI